MHWVITVAAAIVILALCTGVAQAAFPGKNGRIAFVTSTLQNVGSAPDCDGGSECDSYDSGSMIEAVDPDGGRRRAVTRCHGGDALCMDDSPAFSPDGKHLAFGPPTVPFFPDLRVGIVIARADGSARRVLPPYEHHSSQPAWSPDGRKLAFTSVAGGLPETSIYVMADNGGAVRRLTVGKNDEDPAWSARGLVAFTRQAGVHRNVYVIASDGTAERQLTFRGGGHPAWSPHGSKLVFERYVRNRRSRGTNLFLIGAGGNGLRQLTFGGGQDAAWSPDGRKVVFVRGRHLYAVRFDGHRAQRIARAPGKDSYRRSSWLSSPDWQPRR